MIQDIKLILKLFSQNPKLPFCLSFLATIIDYLEKIMVFDFNKYYFGDHGQYAYDLNVWITWIMFYSVATSFMLFKDTPRLKKFLATFDGIMLIVTLAYLIMLIIKVPLSLTAHFIIFGSIFIILAIEVLIHAGVFIKFAINDIRSTKEKEARLAEDKNKQQNP